MDKNRVQKINKTNGSPQATPSGSLHQNTTPNQYEQVMQHQNTTPHQHEKVTPHQHATPHHHTTHAQTPHTHPHENTKAVLNRLSRAIGHLKSIKVMVEDGRDCSEVLIQLSAVKAAINNTGKVVLKDHLSHCLIDSIETGNMEAIEELNKAIDQFVK